MSRQRGKDAKRHQDVVFAPGVGLFLPCSFTRSSPLSLLALVMAALALSAALLPASTVGTLYSEEGPVESLAVLVWLVLAALLLWWRRPPLLSIAWAVVAAVLALREAGLPPVLFQAANDCSPSPTTSTLGRARQPHARRRTGAGVPCLPRLRHRGNRLADVAAAGLAGALDRRDVRRGRRVAAQPDLRGPARLAREHVLAAGTTARRTDLPCARGRLELLCPSMLAYAVWRGKGLSLAESPAHRHQRGAASGGDAGVQRIEDLASRATVFLEAQPRLFGLDGFRVRLPIIPSTSPMSWPRSSSKVCSSRRSAREIPGSSVGREWRSRRPP